MALDRHPVIPASIESRLEEDLASLRSRGLWRQCVTLDSPPGPRISIEGKDYLHLCSNNYLGLASHPAVIEAAQEAAARWGTGAGAARLITGTSRPARDLEEELAEFKQAEAAALFSSGYMANLGLLPIFGGEADWLVCDSLNHASLIDAARLSRAQVCTYPHGDLDGAAAALARAPSSARKSLLTESVFSMDGDLAPLAQLNDLALSHGAWLIVDDAHGTGVLGPEGRGACAAAGIAGDHLVQIVTLSKALGSQGGAIVGSRRLIDLLINSSRTFIFETALAPPAVAAARAALDIVRTDEDRRSRLQRNIGLLRGRFAQMKIDLPPDETPILPLIVGENDRAVRAAEQLASQGFWVTPIRPPSVPDGAARLRITAMADHEPGDLNRFADALAGVLGLPSSSKAGPASTPPL